MTAQGSDSQGPDREPTAYEVLAPYIDLITPMAVRAAATLGVADPMAQGPVRADELAQRLGCDTEALTRMLRHLVAHGVFAEPDPRSFALNRVAELLRSDHPSGMGVQLDLDGFGGQMDLAFAGILHTLRTGEPAWESVFGAPFWRYLDAHPAMSESFDAMMASGPEYVADAMEAYDWSTAQHVVDVGGGTGALLAAILESAPQARGTLVDLPDTGARAREYLATRRLDGRCDVVAQSFFDQLPRGGDVYVLSGVIHDWPDQEATAILRRCAEAAGDEGRIVILEGHGSEGGDPAMFAEMDLRMLVLVGGRERNIEGYTALALKAGLSVAEVHPTPLGQVGIECIPATAAKGEGRHG